MASASSTPAYLRATLTVVRVYRSTGEVEPASEVREATKARAPWYREIWFGWEETPRASKVMRTSIVAVGGVVVALLEPLEVGVCDCGCGVGCVKASRRRVAILSADQVVFMESGKSLQVGRGLVSPFSLLYGPSGMAKEKIEKEEDVHRVVDDKDVLPPPQAQDEPALDQLAPADVAEALGVAAAQAQDLDVVAQRGAREGEHGGGEEHGLVVRVGDEQAHAPAAQDGEALGGHAGRVEVQTRHEEGEEGDGQEGGVHGGYGGGGEAMRCVVRRGVGAWLGVGDDETRREMLM